MKNKILSIFPANSLQQGFIYHALSHPEDDAYMMQLLLDYHIDLDVDLYLKAWSLCVEQYPMLRTGFNWEEELIQIVYQKGDLDFFYHDISHVHDIKERDNQIELIRRRDRLLKFDLNRPQLFRLHIIKQASNLYTVIKTKHHIISDGWSEAVLLKRLSEYYDGLIDKRTISIKEDTAYARAQEYIFKNRSRAQASWLYLKDITGPNNIQSLFSQTIDLTSHRHVERPAHYTLRIETDNYLTIKGFSVKNGITLNVLTQFAWHKIIQLYSSDQQTIVGTTISGRGLPIEGIEQSVGLYINTLPLVIDWSNDISVLDQLHYIQKRIAHINSDGFVDLVKLQENGSRLFYSIFVFENYPSFGKADDPTDFNVRGVIEKSDYPLSVTVQEIQNSLVIDLEYDSDYLHSDKAGKLLSIFKNIILQAAEKSDLKHSRLSLLDEEDRSRILYEWNKTDGEPNHFSSIVQLFERQVISKPYNTAIFFEGKSLCYHELNELSNQLARQIRLKFHALTRRPLTPDTIIALYLDRSIEMVVAILAVWKAGGAYVPIDIKYPEQRVSFVLQDTEARLILCQQGIKDSIPLDFQDRTLVVDLSEEFYSQLKKTNLDHFSDSTDLAYVLYTSGTSGVPKGVMVQHQGVINHVSELLVECRIEPLEHFLLLANYVFDASVEQMHLSLASGGVLFVIPASLIADGISFMDYIEQNKITHLDATPSFVHSLDPTKLKSLKRLTMGGEAMSEKLLRQFSGHVPLIINTYGPTETTITVLVGLETTLIGKAIKNTKTYVLDAQLNPVPVGVVGELYIGGICLARGYLNQPELTSERFIVNPFATESDIAKGYTRLYKTGDLVRWMDDGNIEYIGRNDDQVKIRGYRIELGEIEHSLGQLPGIRQCCVVEKVRNTSSGKTKHLVGYYIKSDPKADVAVSDLLTLLGQKLPEYMVPSALVELENFPLTINGKLDKQALPDPEHSVLANYVAPAGEIEKKLCGIWQEVLGLERVGTTDNFFRIGGDSILSIQLTSRIRQGGLPCQVKDIFEFKTIGRLAEQIDRRTETVSIQSEQGCVVGDCDLLPIQSWFFDQVRNGSFIKYNHWNQSFLIKTSVLELPKLQRIVQQLTDYHDVLRMRYAREQTPGGIQWKQAYQPTATVSELKTLNVKGLSVSALDEVLTRWQSDFDLEKGPLFQMGYLYGYEDESCRIYFALHHLVVDGVSWRILNEDIRTLYSGNSLSSKGSSYRQWVNNLKDYADRNPGEAAYWQQQLMDIPRYDLWEASTETLEVSRLELSLDLTDALLHQAPQSYHTEINDLLLTALAYALKNQNGYDVQGITLEGHGRESTDSSIDITRTVGWFTSLFPVRLELQEEVGESIQFIKESLRHIPNKGIGFGVFASNNRSEFSNENLPRITFNYMGQLDAKAGEWEIVGEPSGINFHAANRSHNLIDINGAVIGGRLVFSVATRLGKQNTEMLCESFRFHLHEVIEHCLGQLARKDSRYTPSDFEDFNPYEIVNEDQEGDPIFFLPPGGAGIGTYFTSIIPVLKHRKLVALNDYYTFIRDTKKINVSNYKIENLGKYSRMLVRRLQPCGSYTVVGFSWGGVLAFEVCRQLVQEGCTIKNLFILDSHFSYRHMEQYLPDKLGYVEEFRKNIHYAYNPKVNLIKLAITLFKSRRSMWNELPIEPDNLYQMVDRSLEAYFIEARFNGLEHFAQQGCDIEGALDIIEMDCHHGEILKIKDAVQVVCECLIKKI